MATTDVPVVEVEHLSTTFMTTRGPLRAVNDVSFAIARGETLGIVGESGSGKSVLVRSVMGLLPPSARVRGTIKFQGRDTKTLKRSEQRHFWGREIAMVFQDPMTSLNPTRTIGAQITESIEYHLDLSKKEAESRAIELLGHVGIPEPRKRLRQYPHQLSGGMRQRVTIAIAIACWPKLLIADEPTTALDVTIQKQILDLLGSLQREYDMTMAIITHDLGVVAGRADRVAVMYAGRFVERASTTDLFAQPRHPYTEALLRSIPRLDQPSHTRLDAIGGRPPDMTRPPVGCAFAQRCRYAQPRCLEERPLLTPIDADLGQQREAACFFPVGTPEGDDALARNEAAAVTAAGTSLDQVEVS